MEQTFDIRYVAEFIPKLLTTLNLTLLIVAGALVLGTLAGFAVALPRLYRIPVLKELSALYVSFFRGTPIIIQLFLIYYGLPEILKAVHVDVTQTPVLIFVILTFGLHAGAFISENIRASVTSVDRGQVEAAYAVGMTGRQAFARIVLPQALALAVPVFGNLVLAMVKETSLAFTLGVMELTGKAQTLGALTQHFIETYLALALIYLAVCYVLEKLMGLAEKRLQRHMHMDRRERSGFGRWRSPSLGGLLRGMGLPKKEAGSYEA